MPKTGVRKRRGNKFRSTFNRRKGSKKRRPEKTQEQLDAEMMLYQAEKEGRDKEQVKLEIEKMKREREKSKLDEEMDEYFKKR
ncbi:hypothetical protein GAYE_SCF02G2065 [Galdieria yellowstonensis]|uniref:Chromatin target of PRMT1 protein C-terminal domain-containing protein n=1 Tax=Galdieria yellowstonensis TaxID=3028027 RepID=A0AAV9IA53_9RHOD|nr:hypothetical protein GAYE_SCF02G2065 [Galdieria yellowstonensis]